MRVIDLFCGIGGWSKAFLQAGHHCIGFDITDHGYPGEFIQAECPLVIEYLEWLEPDLVIASPPCEGYARYHLPWLRKLHPTPPDTSLLRWSVGLVDRLACPVIVECSLFAARHVPGAFLNGSYALWGNLPLPMPRLPRKKMQTSGTNPAGRAELPSELSNHVLRWMLDRSPRNRTQ